MDFLGILHDLRHLIQSDPFSVSAGNAKILSHIFSQSIDIIGCVAVHSRNRILYAADLLRFQHIFRIHFP